MRGYEILRKNARIMRMFFKHAPAYSALSLLGGGLNAVCQVVSNTLLVRFLYDALQLNADFGRIGWALVGVLALMGIKSALNCWVEERMSPQAVNRVRRHMQFRLFERAQHIGLMAYDDPAYYDRLVFAMEQADGRAMEIFSDIRRMVELLTCYLGMLGVIFSLDAGAFLPALGCFAASYISGNMRAGIEFQREQEGLPFRRKMAYFPECIIRRGCAQELRMSGMDLVLEKGHGRAARELQEVNGHWGSRLLRVSVLGTLMGDGLCLDFGLYGYLAYLVLSGGLNSVGDMMGLAFAAENTIWRTEELIRLLPRFSGHALFVSRYEEFMGQKE